jgi:hypothetical protein
MNSEMKKNFTFSLDKAEVEFNLLSQGPLSTLSRESLGKGFKPEV